MRSNFPIIRILIPFILGIICYRFFGLHVQWLWVLGVCGLLLILPALWLKTSAAFSYRWLNGIGLHLIVFVIGMQISSMQSMYHNPLHYSQHISDSSFVVGIVQQKLERKAKSYKTTIQVEKIQTGNSAKSAEGDLLLYFTQDSMLPNVSPGQRIAFAANIMPIKNNGNPGEFDYEKYCYGKQISHICFARPDQYVVLDSNIFTLKSFFARQQAKVLAIIHQHISNKNTIGIAEALLVGERSGIDTETWSTYSKAGISHIIAISGMHISLIFQAIVFIITLNHSKKNLRKPAIIIAVLGMWFFAALTGMPASIARAAVMFSFIAIAQLFDLQTKTYNVLALSALCLLCINTQYLFDVGFQLSYAALFGILLFTKKLESYRPSNNFFVKNIWTLVSATLAAQVFALPLCLYYFHQMPLLFIPANLVAIPATLLCLALEIGILLFHFIATPIADFLGTFTQIIIEWNNDFIAWIASFKAAQITQVQLSVAQVISLLAAFVFLSIAWYHKSKNSFLLGLSGLLVCSILAWQIKYQNTQRKKLVILHIPKDSYGMVLQNGYTSSAITRYIRIANTLY
jgi:competence protein ComEC